MKRSLALIVALLEVMSTSCASDGVTHQGTPGGSPTPPPPFHAELQAYWRALERVCETGVTPELTRLYEETVKAVDAAGFGAGRDSNFWGPRNPEHAWLGCFEAPEGTQR